MRTFLIPVAVVSLVACTASKQNVQASASAESHGSLPFIEDDYARAVELSRSKKLPVFVDVWAPW